MDYPLRNTKSVGDMIVDEFHNIRSFNFLSTIASDHFEK